MQIAIKSSPLKMMGKLPLGIYILMCYYIIVNIDYCISNSWLCTEHIFLLFVCNLFTPLFACHSSVIRTAVVSNPRYLSVIPDLFTIDSSVVLSSSSVTECTHSHRWLTIDQQLQCILKWHGRHLVYPDLYGIQWLREVRRKLSIVFWFHSFKLFIVFIFCIVGEEGGFFQWQKTYYYYITSFIFTERWLWIKTVTVKL